MGTTSKRIRRAIALAVTWAVAWAPIAVAVGVLIIDPDNSMDEMWPAIGAYPGFLSGILFSVLLGFAERRRPFNEIPLPLVALLGALSGAVVATVPMLVLTPAPDTPVALLATSFITSVAVLAAASAVISALVVRRSRKRAVRNPRTSMA